MKSEGSLNEYLSHSVEKIIGAVVKNTLSNPAESLFLAKFAKAGRKAAQRRQNAAETGKNVPPFLIASITEQCNLHCKGCYAWANKACGEKEAAVVLTAAEWRRLFEEAAVLGISFILLAGGEPLVRRNVITTAGDFPELVFPIFTNGTLITDEYLALFAAKRNLVPMISMEGSATYTDARRGEGVARRVDEAMCAMKKQGILYGASVTVNRNNIKEVTSAEFLDRLVLNGCKVIIYVEYVPMTAADEMSAFTEEDRQWFALRLEDLRRDYGELLLLSFPGDEEKFGGCLAAGRGFFHINAHGGAEPCPFSPYSDYNVKDGSLEQALKSELFYQLQSGGFLTAAHRGGCTLHEQKEEVAALTVKE